MHRGPAKRSYEQDKERLIVKKQLAEIQAMNKQNKKDMDALIAKMTEQRHRVTKAMRDNFMKDFARKTREDAALYRRTANMINPASGTSSTNSPVLSSSATAQVPDLLPSLSSSASAATATAAATSTPPIAANVASADSVLSLSLLGSMSSSASSLGSSIGLSSSVSSTGSDASISSSSNAGGGLSISIPTNLGSSSNSKLRGRSENTRLEQQVTKAAGVKLEQRLHEMKENEKRLQKLDGYKALPKKLQNQVKAWGKLLRQHETDASTLASEHEIAFMRLVGDQKRRSDQLDEAHTQAEARLAQKHQQENNAVEALRGSREELFSLEKNQEFEIMHHEQDSEMEMLKAKHALQDKQYTARVALENSQLQAQHTAEVQERIKELHLQHKARLKALAAAQKQAERASSTAGDASNSANPASSAVASTPAAMGEDTSSTPNAGQAPPAAATIDKKALRAEQKAEEDELRAVMRQEESKLCETIALEQIPEIGALNRIHEEQLGGVRNSQIAEIKELAARHIAETKAIDEVFTRKHEDMDYKQFMDKVVFFNKHQEEVAAMHFRMKFENELLHEALRAEEMELLRVQHDAETAALAQRNAQAESALADLRAAISKAPAAATPAVDELNAQLDAEAAALKEKAAKDKKALDDNYASQMTHVGAMSQKLMSVASDHYSTQFETLCSQQEKDLMMLKGEFRILVAGHHTENPPQIDFPQHSPFFLRLNSPTVASRSSGATANVSKATSSASSSSSSSATKGNCGVQPSPLHPGDNGKVSSNANAEELKKQPVLNSFGKREVGSPSKSAWRRSADITTVGLQVRHPLANSCASENNSGSSTPLTKASDCSVQPPPAPPLSSGSSVGADSIPPHSGDSSGLDDSHISSSRSRSSASLRAYSSSPRPSDPPSTIKEPISNDVAPNSLTVNSASNDNNDNDKNGDGLPLPLPPLQPSSSSSSSLPLSSSSSQ